MALLKNMATNEVLQLQHQHLFGSAHQWVDTFLVGEVIAPVHAAIFFKDNVWQLECLAPSEPYKICCNNKTVTSGNSVILKIGCTISFWTDNPKWRLINTDPPKYFLHAVHTPDLFIELCESVYLPHNGGQNLKLQKKDNNRWLCLKNGHNYELKEGAILAFEDEVWRFTSILPVGFISSPIPPHDPISSPLFWIYVSKDEEHVHIKVDFNTNLYDLGERAHHYLLLFLARKRRDDMNAGYDGLTQGWVDVDIVAKKLGMEVNVLNMQITRVRRHFTKLKDEIPPLATNIIERRPKQLRFAFTEFKIYRGSELEER